MLLVDVDKDILMSGLGSPVSLSRLDSSNNFLWGLWDILTTSFQIEQFNLKMFELTAII